MLFFLRPLPIHQASGLCADLCQYVRLHLQHRQVGLLVWEGEAWEAMQICLMPKLLLPALQVQGALEEHTRLRL